MQEKKNNTSLIFYASKKLRYKYIILLVLSIVVLFVFRDNETVALLIFGIFLFGLVADLIVTSKITRIELDQYTIRVYFNRMFRRRVIEFDTVNVQIRFVLKAEARGTRNSVLRISDVNNEIDIEPGIGGWSVDKLEMLIKRVNGFKHGKFNDI